MMMMTLTSSAHLPRVAHDIRRKWRKNKTFVSQSTCWKPWISLIGWLWRCIRWKVCDCYVREYLQSKPGQLGKLQLKLLISHPYIYLLSLWNQFRKIKNQLWNGMQTETIDGHFLILVLVTRLGSLWELLGHTYAWDSSNDGKDVASLQVGINLCCPLSIITGLLWGFEKLITRYISSESACEKSIIVWITRKSQQWAFSYCFWSEHWETLAKQLVAANK